MYACIGLTSNSARGVCIHHDLYVCTCTYEYFCMCVNYHRLLNFRQLFRWPKLNVRKFYVRIYFRHLATRRKLNEQTFLTQKFPNRVRVQLLGLSSRRCYLYQKYTCRVFGSHTWSVLYETALVMNTLCVCVCMCG